MREPPRTIERPLCARPATGATRVSGRSPLGEPSARLDGMALAPGDPAPPFSPARPAREHGAPRGLPRPHAARLLLSEGRHARMHDPVVRRPRPPAGARRARGRRGRHLARRAGGAARVRPEVLAGVPVARRHGPRRRRRLGHVGREDPTTGTPTSGSSGHRSWSTTTGRSRRPGTRSSPRRRCRRRRPRSPRASPTSGAAWRRSPPTRRRTRPRSRATGSPSSARRPAPRSPRRSW